MSSTRHARAEPARETTEDEENTSPFSELFLPSEKWSREASAHPLSSWSLLPFTSPFYSEKQARGSRNPSRHPAAVICKQGSAPKCSTGIMILVTLPVHPPLLLIPVSATPARVPAQAHRFSEGACQSIELLMHNHAQITAKKC